MSYVYFTAIIERGDDPGYGVFFPDLPGCTSAGDTIEAAARGAEEALSLHLAGMVEDGQRIPPATPADDIPLDTDVSEAARFLVRAELRGRSVRLNISLDEGLLATLDETAKARGLTRSAFLAEGARRLIKTP